MKRWGENAGPFDKLRAGSSTSLRFAQDDKYFGGVQGDGRVGRAFLEDRGAGEVSGDLEPYTVFADDAEHVQEMGEAEEFPDTLADFEELQLTACRFG